jgi:carbon monoxide dehydrogenase subunit G
MNTAMRALALSALIFTLPAGGMARASEPTLTIARDERGAMVVHAAIDIAAPPATVWAVITDCGRAPSYVPNMDSCRIAQRDPTGRWQLRRTVMNVTLLPRIRTLSRLAFEPKRRMSFTKAGGDMRIAEGEWRLEPLAKGRATRLTYYSALALNFFVPQFLLDQAARRDFPALMKAIERESLKDAGKRPSP